MTTPDLKQQVRAAIESRWTEFAKEHPHLASAIDQATLTEHVARSIADDPEYRSAMDRAGATGAGAELVTDLIGRLVRRVLRTLG